MVEFLFLQITTCRFQAAHHLNCSSAYLAFASRLFTDHARQRFHPFTDNGCCFVCLFCGTRAELSRLDRHTTQRPCLSCDHTVGGAAQLLVRLARESTVSLL